MVRRHLRDRLEGLPWVGSLAARAYAAAVSRLKFPGSARYWEARYRFGGDSGAGSFDQLAEFKRSTLNAFVAVHGLQSAIEFGCGDGRQLEGIAYPRYVGLDVSPTAIRMCAQRFRGDRTKSFLLYDPQAFHDPQGLLRAELAVSLDVVYHLVEQAVFERYMRHLFDSATRHVVIYSSDTKGPHINHVRHRAFVAWVAENISGWALQGRVPNPHPFDASFPERTSASDFYFYGKSP